MTFTYMINKKPVPETEIPAEQLNDLKNLEGDVRVVLEDLSCPRHGREPHVMLMHKHGAARLMGFGPCCEEFGALLRTAIDRSKLASGDMQWETMIKKVTYRGPGEP